ncbi:MAG: DUF971 domain-containing protein [Rhodospirillales bacterium]|jgi:gamma-butyrobetaine dioxygenase|nr:DUF971 domain-containing protein [Rhodospirillales bacterium]MBT4628501.1 DUF971 domain-containing protein [Rhodospirillales bacterium]MBT5350430.1 DUF971 domain-containing protein [Rhodospirillales bacterium]MBT5520047.1 DUF971 domain-containing protein [Rhodospirillales bacterium]MBT6111349.1 DUF971 domain-containing protein [Rhodospirillales bacterium]
MKTLTRADMDTASTILTWSDGRSSQFHHIWLRDNCRCTDCGEPSTGRRSLRLSELDLNVAPEVVDIGSGDLQITWTDGHESQFTALWLSRHAYDDDARRARAFVPTLWDDDFRATPASMSFDAVNSGDSSFLEMLHHVRDCGLCFLKGASAEAGTLEAFAGKVGYIQESNFGRVQDLVVDHSKQSVGNRTVALKAHTDEPYRASPSGILLFHCVETDVTGAGSSIFMDGFEIADVLRTEDPEGFAALAQNRQMFRRHFADDVDLIAEFPVISVDEFHNVTGIRINDRVAAPASISPDQIPAYYRGMKRLLQLAEDPDRMIHLTLQPGDIAVFDNHRILHGRTDLTVNGRRWLQWIQVERGDFHSTLRITADRLQQDRSIDPLLRGAYS